MVDDPLPVLPSSFETVSIPRRDLVKGSLAAAAGLTATGLIPHSGALAQGAGPTLVAGSSAEHAFEFVVTVHQRAFEFELYGILTRVAGIEPSLLFTTSDPTGRDSATGRLTLAGTVTGTSRTILEQIFDVNAEGTLGIYYNEAGGADPAAPESFRTGVQVATLTARLQNVILVTEPQTGLANGSGDLELTASEPFTIAESTFQFRLGEPRLRVSWFGGGSLLDPDLPESIVHAAGQSWLSG
jgi:hypothetical protein